MTRCRRYGCAAPAVVEGFCRPHGQAMAITRMRGREAARQRVQRTTCPAHPSEPLWECAECESISEQRREEEVI